MDKPIPARLGADQSVEKVAAHALPPMLFGQVVVILVVAAGVPPDETVDCRRNLRPSARRYADPLADVSWRTLALAVADRAADALAAAIATDDVVMPDTTSPLLPGSVPGVPVLNG